jgi:eukaryotic-like serine/threonine-protein kinase
MPLSIGSRLGPYDIVAPIGAGGMGEVYRARDSKLNRDVAIKVLLPAVANDPDRLARFSREAQVLGSLNHSNIAQIYGIEDADGVKALVLELVEGEDLAQRIARGPIPPDEALPIARQIAHALEAAHEQGIVHRDLKPANIKVRPDGTVKVLDFGLAKAMDPAGVSSANAMNSPTLSMHATQAGIILGTAAYMSPEQAKGNPLDKRTDIWSFGCVVFEMLTGQSAFAGDSLSETLASILRSEPEWAVLPAAVPASIRRLLRRCLEKDPRVRLHDIADARIEMSGPSEWDEPSSTRPATAGRRERQAWIAAGVLGLTTIAGGVTAFRHVRETSPLAAPITFAVTPPPGTTFTTPLSTGQPWVAVSPDGQTLTFVALGADGRQQLWLRPLAAAVARPLAATDDARAPFWSADGRFIAFFAQGRLKCVEVASGTPQVLADAARGNGGSWAHDGTIVFNREMAGGLERISFAGDRVPVPVTHVDVAKGQHAHVWPEFLPDGRHFLFAATRSNQTETWVGSTDGDPAQFLLNSDANARYAAPGYVLYAVGGVLTARRFDAASRRLVGDAFKVADAAGIANQPVGYATLSASSTGVLVYGTAPVSDQQLVWRDRGGKNVGAVALQGDAKDPSVSPDGSQLAMTRTLAQSGQSIWLLDLKRDVPARLTLDGAAARHATWSPDGKFVAFSKKGNRLDVLYRKAADGSGEEELLLDKEGSIATDWSSDGKFVLFHSAFGAPGDWVDLWVLPLGDRHARPLMTTPFTEAQGVFSPDSKWMAYAGDESGAMEVYVQPFPPTGVKTMVSRDGGAEPHWRSDGRELFYVSPNRRLMTVAITFVPKLTAARPEALFEMNIPDLTSPFARRRYAPMPDGQRFVVVERPAGTDLPSITVVVNWTAALVK